MRLKLYRGKWCAYYARGRRVSLRTSDRVLAEQRLASLKADITRKTGTIGALVESYIVEKSASPAHKWRGWIWDAARDFWQNVEPESVTRELCREYTAQRRKTVKDESIRKEIGLVRAAVRRYAPHSGFNFELPPPSQPKERYLSKTEFKALLDACIYPHMKTFLILAVTTGARKSAILGLTWKKVDFERKLIDFGGGKGNKGRAVCPMNDRAFDALKAAFQARTSEYVIEHGGHQIKDVKHGFMAACRRSGIKGATPHTLRHSAAVWMAESGIPMQEIASYLGHSNMATTYKVYAKFSPDYLQAAAKALEF